MSDAKRWASDPNLPWLVVARRGDGEPSFYAHTQYGDVTVWVGWSPLLVRVFHSPLLARRVARKAGGLVRVYRDPPA